VRNITASVLRMELGQSVHGLVVSACLGERP
jgi:hypothetical protein